MTRDRGRGGTDGESDTDIGGHTAAAVHAARTALAVLVVGGVVLGALLLRSGGPFVRGRGPAGDDSLTITLAIGWAFAVLVLNARYRRRVRRETGPDPDPARQRLVGLVRNALAASAVVVPLLVLGMHRFRTHPVHRRPKRKGHRVVAGGGGTIRHGSNSLPPALVIVCLVLLALAVAVAAVLLWRALREAGRAARTDDSPGPYDEQDRLADAVASGRRALLDGGDARTAVIACYAAMEGSLAASGVARRASDSPQDLLDRAVASGLSAGTAAADLTALFREARYSTHPMDDGHRDRAAAALAEIADRLDDRRTAPAGAGV